ncbi:MAG: hypothetical protein M5U28_20035 [Sandaracinaceae bacterium]|nr:hypothetical protein [Sandaracinaceae bacterium]
MEADGLARCEPYPDGGPEDCPFGEAHFPGEPGCALVGSACPAGEWPEGLPDDGSVLFVRAGAVGGDGTRDAPLGTVTDAAARAGDGSIIALAKGLHTYPAVVRRPVELRGACAAETQLTSPEGIVALRIVQTDVRVRDLSIVDAGAPAIFVDGPDASAELDGVVIARAQLGGVIAFEATVTGRSVLVSDTQGSPEGGGEALASYEGSWIRLERVVLERNHEAGAVAWHPGSASHCAAPRCATRGRSPACTATAWLRGRAAGSSSSRACWWAATRPGRAPSAPAATSSSRTSSCGTRRRRPTRARRASTSTSARARSCRGCS